MAGVLLQERAPGLIDSAGVVADRTLMGFDYLHGEPVAAAPARADPLGPTGGAALYDRAAFEAVGGFDERIFLYYEDLDLALRMAAAGRALPARPRGAGAARLLGQPRRRQRRQVRPHRLEPRLHAAPLRGDVATPRRRCGCWPTEGAISAGQLLLDRTAKGLRGPPARLARGRRRSSAASSTRAALLDISAREALALRRRRRG